MEPNGGISGDTETSRLEERKAELAQTTKNLSRTAAEKMHRAATVLRQRGDGSEGRMTRFADVAASKIDDAAAYVEDVSFSRLRTDLGSVIRTYPMQALAVGIGFGFLASRFVRRSDR